MKPKVSLVDANRVAGLKGYCVVEKKGVWQVECLSCQTILGGGEPASVAAVVLPTLTSCACRKARA